MEPRFHYYSVVVPTNRKSAVIRESHSQGVVVVMTYGRCYVDDATGNCPETMAAMMASIVPSRQVA